MPPPRAVPAEQTKKVKGTKKKKEALFDRGSVPQTP